MKYLTDLSNLKVTLAEYGVAILPALLTEEECEQMKEGMWEYLEHITQRFETPISRDNPESWKELKKLYPKHSMLLQQWGIGHAQFIWNLRQNPKIVEVFSSIWETSPEDLLVSFDGASFHFPPEVTGCGWFRGKSWLHSDQSFTRNDFECVQSWVTAYPVNPGDATLVIMEGSHRYHAEFRQAFKVEDTADWYKLNEEEIQFYLHRGCSIVSIECPAGSLVLWDSRTIHCGQEAQKSRAEPNIRCVAYLCYTPRQRASAKDLKKKVEAIESLRTTSHWPHKVKLFPKTPQTYGGTLPNVVEINEPVLTRLGERLAGYD